MLKEIQGLWMYVDIPRLNKQYEYDHEIVRDNL